ncbi:MAG: hypothetical protein J6031_06755 [Bacteroidales bacterium]|nr:hypothetical protein [Bacteroidales bacterium]
MKIKGLYKLIAVAAAVVGLTTSCIKDERYLTDSSARLVFSEDTVTFDTVFATMATVTRSVRVYNCYDEPLLISTVALQGGGASRFRINVDGDTSRIARDVEIGAHDSIFIFIQANINPNDQTTPYLVEDAIVFGFNNRQQRLPVTAYGRNAVYHNPTYTHQVYSLYINSRGQIDTNWIPFSIIDCANWDHSRPHVIMGYAVVNSNETLHLLPGDELYFADGGCLWVYDSATLDVRGSLSQPVLFSSVRQDSYYDSLPGQWKGIWFSTGSKDSHIEWACIENAIVGIQADTNVNNNPTLDISNSVIQNHSRMGILGQGAWIEGDNLLVHNCGEQLLAMVYGGRYLFSNSTFANYWRFSSRKTPSVWINNYYKYDETTTFPRPIQQAEFRNCIIYGNYSGNDNKGEVLFDWLEGCDMNCVFHNCLVRSSLIDSDGNATFTPAPLISGSSVIVDSDPKFNDIHKHDYELQDESPAKGAGNSVWLKTSTDLKGNPRGNPPTIGAYEIGS